MPEVNGKKFPYTKKGVAAAKKTAKKTKSKINFTKPMASSDGVYMGK